MKYSREQILQQLAKVIDPELGLNIVALGLVYEATQNGDEITICMTLTTPGCPMSSYFRNEIEMNLMALEGVNSVDVQFVFDPPWSPEMIDQEAAKTL